MRAVVAVAILMGLVLVGYGLYKSTAPPADPLVGQQRHVVNPGFQTVTLFTSNDDLTKGIVAQSVGDDTHAVDIARRGRVVPAGSQVTVVATGSAYSHPSAQVRLLDGTTGWVTMDKLSP